MTDGRVLAARLSAGGFFLMGVRAKNNDRNIHEGSLPKRAPTPAAPVGAERPLAMISPNP